MLTVGCTCGSSGVHYAPCPFASPPVQYYPAPVAYGWICPLCGGANAPATSRCACKPLPTFVGTGWPITTPWVQPWSPFGPTVISEVKSDGVNCCALAGAGMN